MSDVYAAPAAVPAADAVPSNVFGTPPVGAPQYVPAVNMPTPGAPAGTLDYAAAVAVFNQSQQGVQPMPLAPAAPVNAPPAYGTVPQSQYLAPPQPGPAVPANAAPPVAPVAPQAPAAPVADLQTQLAQVANDYGVAPHLVSQFKDVDSARAAIAMFASQAAVAGLNYTGQPAQSPYPQYPQQPQPYQPQQQPQLPALPPDVLKLDLDDVVIDEKSRGNFEALRNAYLQQQQQFQQLVGKFEQQEQLRRETVRTENKRIAYDVVEKVAADRYGTANARTPQQEYALATLFRKADEIQMGYFQNGLPIPKIDAVVRQALLLEGNAAYVPATAQPVQQAPSPYGEVPPSVPISGAPPAPRAAAPVPSNLKPTSHLGNLHQDPAFMQVAQRLLSRP